MATAMRTFVDQPAVRSEVPLLLGIVGSSGSGKTYSALRLATGMQQVIAGDIFMIDTEHNRGLNYADIFKFRHIPFNPPFASLDYLRAIEYCMRRGGKIIVIDSMTHEHSGEGGYLASAERFLEWKCKGKPEGDHYSIRAKNSRTKWIGPSADRKALTNGIVQMGISGIFCYRAQEKLDEDFKPLGWEPETTSRLIYEMQQQFLLLPGSDGIPKIQDATATERRLIKTPAQFRDWFKQGQRLDETMGVKMAQWAAGSKVQTSPPAIAPASHGAGRGAVESPSASPSLQGSPLQEGTGNVGSGADSETPHDNSVVDKPSAIPAAWQISFFGKLAPLKKANEEKYYEILLANGYHHANEITSRAKALEILEEMRVAINGPQS